MYSTWRQNKTTAGDIYLVGSSDGEIQNAAKINKLEFDFESFTPFLYGAWLRFYFNQYVQYKR